MNRNKTCRGSSEFLKPAEFWIIYVKFEVERGILQKQAVGTSQNPQELSGKLTWFLLYNYNTIVGKNEACKMAIWVAVIVIACSVQ